MGFTNQFKVSGHYQGQWTIRTKALILCAYYNYTFNEELLVTTQVAGLYYIRNNLVRYLYLRKLSVEDGNFTSLAGKFM